jgi:predicted transcriptional regulator
MDSIRRENEKVTAVGNAQANARGDIVRGGRVTKTAEEIARESSRVQTAIINAGLKGPMPEAESISMDTSKQTKAPVAVPAKKTKEVELPSGDIVIEGDDSDS